MTSTLQQGWPQGRPIAMSVSVMLEGWTDDAAPGIGPMGNPLKPGVYDTQAKSWAEYGANAGAWRLLDVLEDTNTNAVFYVSGVLAERHPALMRAIVEQGHAVAAHAWSQHIIPAYQTPDEERADLKRCISVLEATSGVRPKGWISPRATPSLNTPEILAGERVSWIADAFDRDLPYRVKTAKGDIVAIPFTTEINDFPLCIRYGNEPDMFVRVLQSVLDGWSGIRSPAACLDLTAHAHVFGRPAGAIAFKRAIELCKESRLTWLTHHAHLAGLVMDERV
ncbi:polysaccharide deacetylase family protein [Rhodoplanes sp. Z2-YC6860]|uniref:polysaccharide deacetylase family protein n=1 Tax=Rhodoplanes sp. Z2-YC6860 TaxID=674703 RepID=UPI00078BCD17|nr:polysaccharide deacetylase family protein [Rhodoplanes sp. Z2-YC6860]AMN39629.1 polysaccharide deacetylase [Rhodoplanes sp. Z2-YC6860]